MIAASSLLYPRLSGLRNQARRLGPSGWSKVVGAAVFVIGVWIGLSYGLVHLLQLCYRVELLGPYLVDRLLVVLLLTFSGVLLLSNMVTSLALYYLSAELQLVNAAPVSRLRLFYSKYLENLAASSWMVVVFGVPVVLAYGVVHGAPGWFYALAGVTLLALLVVPASIGIVVTTVLVNVFPARATRDLFIIISALFLGGAWLMLRVVRPEQLVSPDGFSGLAQFLSALSVPESVWLPSTHAAAALAPAMRGELAAALPHAAYLVLWAAACVVLCAWVTTSLYAGGWSRAQEGRPARLRGLAGTRVQRVLSALTGRVAGAVMAKDLKVLVRDATQWSQLILLVALVAIYLFSIHALPFEALAFDTRAYRNAVAFMNIGLTGFVQASVAARFVYPSISAEGRGIWLLRAAPTSARQILIAKWLAGAVPILIFGEVLAVASNMLLQTDDVVRWVAVGNAVLSAFAVSALAAGLGAMMPDFKAENAAKVATSFGGLVFMAVALAYLFVVVLLQAYPTYRLLMYSAFADPLPGHFFWAALGGYGGAAAMTGGVILLALRSGAGSLARREL